MSTEQSNYQRIRANLLQLCDNSIAFGDSLTDDEDFHLDFRLLESGKLLRSARVSVAEDRLPIALFADFQVGKSTTATAMVDGREITPHGKIGGLRTSTVPIRLVHDSHAERPRVRLHLYSRQEIQNFVIPLIQGSLLEKEKLTKKRISRLNFDNKRDLNLVKKALREMAEKTYRRQAPRFLNARIDGRGEDEKNSRAQSRDLMEKLHRALLITAFYETPERKSLQQGLTQSVSSILPFVTFPLDLEKKWLDTAQSGFDVERHFTIRECLYVFIESVTIFVKSDFLEKSGIVVIDPPGVMASAEDTERALNAANESALILFLLKDDTQLSQPECDMIETLRAGGYADRIVFAVNWREAPSERVRRTRESAILNALAREGFSHIGLYRYNALLAMRAAQGRLIQSGALDGITERAIREEADIMGKSFSSTREAWRKLTVSALLKLDMDNLDFDDLVYRLKKEEEEGKPIGEQTLSDITAASHWNELIDTLLDIIISRHAPGLLRDTGLRAVLAFLADARSQLESISSGANQGMAQIDEDYAKSKRLLDTFKKETEELIEENLGEERDTELALSYYNDVIIRAIDNSVEEIGAGIYRETSVMNYLRDFFGKAGSMTAGLINKAIGALNDTFDFNIGQIDNPEIRSEISDVCARIVSDCLKEEIIKLSHGWANNLEDSKVYDLNIRKPALRIQTGLRRIWQQLDLDSSNLLDSVAPKQAYALTGNLSGDFSMLNMPEVMSQSVNGAADVEKPDALVETPWLTAAMTGTGIYGAFVFVGIAVEALFLPAIIVGSIVAAIASVYMYGVADEKKTNQAERLGRKICENLKERLEETKESVISKLIDNGLSEPRLLYFNLFHSIVESQYDVLNDAYKARASFWKQDKEHRARIVEKVEEKLKRDIPPLEKDAEAIRLEVEKIWPNG